MVELWDILPVFLIYIVNKYCLFIGKGWPQNPVSLVVVLVLVTTFSAAYLSIRKSPPEAGAGPSPRVKGQRREKQRRGQVLGALPGLRGPTLLRRRAQHSQTRPFVPESRGVPQLSNWTFTNLLREQWWVLA